MQHNKVIVTQLKIVLKKIKAIGILLNGLMIISVVLIFLYKFIFVNCPEWIDGASIVGEIFYNILLAIVASYIFYFIVVHNKDYNEKKIVAEIIKAKLLNIIDTKNTFLNKLFELANIQNNENIISLDTLKSICNKIKVDQNFALSFSEIPVFEYRLIDFLNFNSKQINSTIEDIYKIPHLEAALIFKLNKIQTSRYIRMISLFDGFKEYKQTSLSPFSEPIFIFNELVEKLSEYIIEIKKTY